MLFIEAYGQYLKYIDNRQKAQTKQVLKERFKNVILPYFKDMDIYKIDKMDYIEFQNKLVNKKYSYSYIRGIHYLLVAFFKYCMTFYELKTNIFMQVGSVIDDRHDDIKDNYFTEKQFKKFIKYVDNQIYKTFFRFMFFAGTRPGEAMALRFSDFIDGSVSINKTISEHHIDGKRVITTPKTKTSYRDIKLPILLIYQLNKLKKYYIKQYNNSEYDYYIFGGLKPLAPTTINRYKLKACAKAKLNPITLHGFRHSHATMLLDHNLSIKAIQVRLGHSSTSTTTSIYLHNTKKQQKRVQRTLNFVTLSCFR